MQKKREDILASGLVRKAAGFSVGGSRDGTRQAEPGNGDAVAVMHGVSEGRPQAAASREESVDRSDLVAAAREVMTDFSELICDETSAGRYRGIIEDFLWTGLAAQARVSGRENPQVPREEVSSAVAEAISAYLKDKAASLAAAASDPRSDDESEVRERLMRSFGAEVKTRNRGERSVMSVEVALDRRGGRKRVEEIISEIISPTLADSFDEPTIAAAVREISRYAHGSSSVAERFREQVAGVERGKLSVRDCGLLVAAAEKLAESLRRK
jgi:hypothetical protein